MKYHEQEEELNKTVNYSLGWRSPVADPFRALSYKPPVLKGTSLEKPYWICIKYSFSAMKLQFHSFFQIQSTTT